MKLFQSWKSKFNKSQKQTLILKSCRDRIKLTLVGEPSPFKQSVGGTFFPPNSDIEFSHSREASQHLSVMQQLSLAAEIIDIPDITVKDLGLYLTATYPIFVVDKLCQDVIEDLVFVAKTFRRVELVANSPFLVLITNMEAEMRPELFAKLQNCCADHDLKMIRISDLENQLSTTLHEFCKTAVLAQQYHQQML